MSAVGEAQRAHWAPNKLLHRLARRFPNIHVLNLLSIHLFVEQTLATRTSNVAVTLLWWNASGSCAGTFCLLHNEHCKAHCRSLVPRAWRLQQPRRGISRTLTSRTEPEVARHAASLAAWRVVRRGLATNAPLVTARVTLASRIATASQINLRTCCPRLCFLEGPSPRRLRWLACTPRMTVCHHMCTLTARLASSTSSSARTVAWRRPLRLLAIQRATHLHLRQMPSLFTSHCRLRIRRLVSRFASK